MESTFGLPRYRLPPRDEVIDRAPLTSSAPRSPTENARHPRLPARQIARSHQASSPTHGIPVLQHPAIYEISHIYEAMRHAARQRRPLRRTAIHFRLSTFTLPSSTLRRHHAPARHELLPPRRPRPHRLHRHHRLGRRPAHQIPLASRPRAAALRPRRLRPAPRNRRPRRPPAKSTAPTAPKNSPTSSATCGHNAQTLAPRKQKLLF